MSKNFSLGVFLGVLISILIGLVFYNTKIAWNREITSGELITALLGLFIAIYVPISIGQSIENKKTIKAISIEEIEQMGNHYQSLEDVVERGYLKDLTSAAFKTLAQSKLRHISNKILNFKDHYPNSKSLQNLELRNNGLREEMTEKFSNRGFKVDDNYIQLFTKLLDDSLIELYKLKREIINS